MAYHMENTVGISNFSKHNSDEETISNESPKSYTKFQRRQAKTSGEFWYWAVAVSGPAGTDEWLNMARNKAQTEPVAN